METGLFIDIAEQHQLTEVEAEVLREVEEKFYEQREEQLDVLAKEIRIDTILIQNYYDPAKSFNLDNLREPAIKKLRRSESKEISIAALKLTQRVGYQPDSLNLAIKDLLEGLVSIN